MTPDALTGGQFFYEDTRLGARDNPDEQYLPSVWPRAFLQNNIIPWKDNSKCAYTCAPLGLYGHALMSFGANLVAPGQVTATANVQPTGWSGGGLFQNGVNTSYDYIDGWSLSPINRNLGGFVPANFISYNVYPVDTNLVPYANSNAIGAAKPLTGQLAYYPPRFNAVDAAMSPFTPRAELSVVGAYDPGSAIGKSRAPLVATSTMILPPVTALPTTTAVVTLPPVSSKTAAQASEWVKVGMDGVRIHGLAGMTFRFGAAKGPQEVLAGCDGKTIVPAGWLTKTLTSDADFTADAGFFGGDPAFCRFKEVDVQTRVGHGVATKTITQTVTVSVRTH